MRVTLTEDKHRQFSASAGYGSEETARVSASWTHVNFMGDARQVGVEAKYSSLDRGVRAEFKQPYFFIRHLAFSAQGLAWDENEPVYRLQSYGGRATVAWVRDDRAFARQRGSKVSVGTDGHQRVHQLSRVGRSAGRSGFPGRTDCTRSGSGDWFRKGHAACLSAARRLRQHTRPVEHGTGYGAFGSRRTGRPAAARRLPLHRGARRRPTLHAARPPPGASPIGSASARLMRRPRAPPSDAERDRPVLQTLLPWRIHESPRLGPLRGLAVDRQRSARRRPLGARRIVRAARAPDADKLSAVGFLDYGAVGASSVEADRGRDEGGRRPRRPLSDAGRSRAI